MADGFEIDRAGALVTGGLFTVVVVAGATVVGVTTVVGVGTVVVGLVEPFEVERDVWVADVTATRAWRVSRIAMGRLGRFAIVVVVVVVVVDATVVVVANDVVVPMPSRADGRTMFAMAGSAVVLRMIPTTREPIEPMSTERRGPRRDVEDRPLGSPERFCPCVILVMDQLSKIKSKGLSTVSQYLVKSVDSPQPMADVEGQVRQASNAVTALEFSRNSRRRDAVTVSDVKSCRHRLKTDRTVRLESAHWVSRMHSTRILVVVSSVCGCRRVRAVRKICSSEIAITTSLSGDMQTEWRLRPCLKIHSGRGPSRKGMLVVHLREF